MAGSKEILSNWLNQGNFPTDNSVIDSLYGMNAPTDELAEKRFLEMYGNVEPFTDADRITDPTIPSMENVIAILGLADDPNEHTTIKNPRTKEQKFIEDLPKKQSDWKKKITKNPVYGERGWETVKEIWKQAVHDKMLEDIAKARYESVNDGSIAGFITRTAFPRTTERLANAGDIAAKDVLGDLAENAAMAIPGGTFTGIAGKGLARVAPRVVNWVSAKGPGIASNALKGAARMGGNLFGNAVVPFATEAMDAAIYGDDDEGMEHRADFSLGDALIGTAINQGVNRGIMRLGGPMLDLFSPGGLAEGGSGKVRKLLENMGQPFSKKGDDFANSVRQTAALTKTNEKGKLRPDDVNSFTRGSEAVVYPYPEEASSAFNKASVLDDIDKGKLAIRPKKSQIEQAELNNRNKKTEIRQKLRDTDKRIDELESKNDLIQTQLDDIVADETSENITNRLYDAQVKNHGEIDALKLNKAHLTNELQKDYNNIGVNEIFEFSDYPPTTTLPASTVLGVLESNLPEYINYAKWHTKGPGSATRLNKFASAMNQGVPSWFVNKYGSEGDATMLLSPFFPETKKAIDESRKEVHEAPRKRNMTKGAADVLKVVSDSGDLTEEDSKFLTAIAENPDILKFGYADDPDAFNLWLLERGNGLLQGTSAFRPTFGVD